MAKFNPTMLVPAQLAPEFNKAATGRTVQQVALDNIDKMREQYAAGEAAEGKLNFKVAGDKVAFTIRVSNSALVLERTRVQDTNVDVKEMSVPKVNFLDARDFYADRIKAGEYDAQIALLTDKKEARMDKMRATRAANRGAPAA